MTLRQIHAGFIRLKMFLLTLSIHSGWAKGVQRFAFTQNPQPVNLKVLLSELQQLYGMH
jgi:hypothetical protein